MDECAALSGGMHVTGTGGAGDAPLMVHLSHRGAGDRFFRNALHTLEVGPCTQFFFPAELPLNFGLTSA